MHLGMTAAGIIGSASAVGVGIWRWNFAYSHYGPAITWRWSAPWYLIALFFGFLTLILAFRLWLLRGYTVFTYPAGMTISRAGDELTTLWNDVRQVHTSAVRYGFPDLPWGMQATLTLQVGGGRQVRLTQDLADLGGLIELVKQRVYPRLLAEYTRAFHRGDPLAFGPLTITSQGVLTGRRMLRWEEISEPSLDGGHLLLQTLGSKRISRLRIPVNRVPNVDLCLQLLQHIWGTVRQPKAMPG